MANVSGFMGTVMLTFGNIAYHYSKFKMYEKVSNKAFCLERKDKQGSEIVKEIVKSKIQKMKANKQKMVDAQNESARDKQSNEPVQS